MRGKARAVVFDPEMHATAMHLLQIESALRWALQRSELRVNYQPIVALETGLVVGFEALVRWQHPERGLLLPGEFIGIAEETGLIVPIGWWVLAEACRQMREWHQAIPETASMWVTVNVSVKQLIQPDILEQIHSALNATGLSSESLRLEITESMLIEHSERVADVLDQIRALGIRVSMDDFGTGYSSLSYLQRLPVDALKIDRSFISQLGIAQDRSEIVKAILSLAHAMGLQAVAEGTETAEQVEYLRDHSCEFGQGWLYAKALDPDQIGAIVGTGRPLGGHPPRKTVKP
jgi:EAL domain-containing protein (putative c-di-GMP-specific phosphodiesterase class I)